MANEPESMAAVIAEFAASHDMTLVPAVPADGDRAVLLGPGILDLPRFLDLARKLGDGAIYLRAEEFGLDPDDVPAHLARYKGQTCELQAAFASAGHGLLHFWVHTAPWYREWLDAEDARLLPDDDQGAGQERTRLAGEIAEAIIADPEFRAATSYARDYLGQRLVPKGTDQHVGWDAVAQAKKMAQEQSAAAYRAAWDRLDEYAAELVDSASWRSAGSAPGRKRAAEQFLASRTDGFPVQAGLREDLYGRARDIAKSRGGSGLF